MTKTDRRAAAPSGGAFGWAGAGAAAVAGAYLVNRASATRAEARYPPVGAFVEVDGTRLHYVERGEGRPVVLIHGSGALVQDFIVSGLLDRLARSHRVIAFDRPGYGYSTRPRRGDWSPEGPAALFVAACSELGVERPLVVGHSWGTLPAVAWALDNPGQAAALVLISGYYNGTPRPDALMTGIAAMPVIGDLLTNTVLPLQTRLTGPLGLKVIFSPRDVPQRFLDEMPFALMLRPSHLHATAADSGQMPLAAARLSERYAELALPMAIVWSERDKLVGQPGQSARLADELPHAAPILVPDGGHMIHHVELERVAMAIENVAAEAGV